MIGHAYIDLDGEEYPIGNLDEIEYLIRDLKRGSILKIMWLGTLEVEAIHDNTYFRMKDGIERKMLGIFCRKAVSA